MRSRIVPLLFTIPVNGLLIAGFAVWVFAQIAEEVLQKETQAFDTLILQSIMLLHTPLLDRVMLGITLLGQPSILLGVSLILGIVLLIFKRRPEAITLAIAALGAVSLNYWLKLLFARDRPALWEHIVNVRYYSFPSGHAMVAVVMYGLTGYLLTTSFHRWRGWVLGLTVLLVVAIGFSRLYLGVHWPSDILAGYAAGLVWLIACILSLEAWRTYRLRLSLLEKKLLSSTKTPNSRS